MSDILAKVKDIFGFENYDYDEDDDFENDEEYEEFNGNSTPSNDMFSNKGKLIKIGATKNVKVEVVKPREFEEVIDICDMFKNRNIVLINTTELDKKIAQRLLDCVSGACYSLEGDLQQIETGVYILAPSHVEVTSELKNALSSKSVFSWRNNR